MFQLNNVSVKLDVFKDGWDVLRIWMPYIVKSRIDTGRYFTLVNLAS